MTPREVRSIKKKMKLENGTLWIYPDTYAKTGTYSLFISREDFSHLDRRIKQSKKRKK